MAPIASSLPSPSTNRRSQLWFYVQYIANDHVDNIAGAISKPVYRGEMQNRGRAGMAQALDAKRTRAHEEIAPGGSRAVPRRILGSSPAIPLATHQVRRGVSARRRHRQRVARAGREALA